MCANYKPPSIADLLILGLSYAGPVAEAYPASQVPILTNAEGRSMHAGSFGMLPHWAKPSLARQTYNARSETVAEKPSFRSAWRQRQWAILPAAAFFEPRYGEDGKSVRWRIERPDRRPFGIAAIWERRFSEGNASEWSASMLTINATDHPLMRQFHAPEDEKRTVVVLDDDCWDDWLNARTADDARALLTMPADVELVATADPRPARAPKAERPG